MTFHRGARHHLIAQPGQPRCSEHLQFPGEPAGHDPHRRCMYTAGHDGLHFRSPVAWGAKPSQPQVVDGVALQ